MNAATRAFCDVMTDVAHLMRFQDTQNIQRGVWDNIPADVRKRFVKQGYVKIQKYRVILTELALEVMEYREATA